MSAAAAKKDPELSDFPPTAICIVSPDIVNLCDVEQVKTGQSTPYQHAMTVDKKGIIHPEPIRGVSAFEKMDKKNNLSEYVFFVTHIENVDRERTRSRQLGPRSFAISSDEVNQVLAACKKACFLSGYLLDVVSKSRFYVGFLHQSRNVLLAWTEKENKTEAASDLIEWHNAMIDRMANEMWREHLMTRDMEVLAANDRTRTALSVAINDLFSFPISEFLKDTVKDGSELNRENKEVSTRQIEHLNKDRVDWDKRYEEIDTLCKTATETFKSKWKLEATLKPSEDSPVKARQISVEQGINHLFLFMNGVSCSQTDAIGTLHEIASDPDFIRIMTLRLALPVDRVIYNKKKLDIALAIFFLRVDNLALVSSKFTFSFAEHVRLAKIMFPVWSMKEFPAEKKRAVSDFLSLHINRCDTDGELLLLGMTLSIADWKIVSEMSGLKSNSGKFHPLTVKFLQTRSFSSLPAELKRMVVDVAKDSPAMQEIFNERYAEASRRLETSHVLISDLVHLILQGIYVPASCYIYDSVEHEEQEEEQETEVDGQKQQVDNYPLVDDSVIECIKEELTPIVQKLIRFIGKLKSIDKSNTVEFILQIAECNPEFLFLKKIIVNGVTDIQENQATLDIFEKQCEAELDAAMKHHRALCEKRDSMCAYIPEMQYMFPLIRKISSEIDTKYTQLVVEINEAAQKKEVAAGKWKRYLYERNVLKSAVESLHEQVLSTANALLTMINTDFLKYMFERHVLRNTAFFVNSKAAYVESGEDAKSHGFDFVQLSRTAMKMQSEQTANLETYVFINAQGEEETIVPVPSVQVTDHVMSEADKRVIAALTASSTAVRASHVTTLLCEFPFLSSGHFNAGIRNSWTIVEHMFTRSDTPASVLFANLNQFFRAAYHRISMDPESRTHVMAVFNKTMDRLSSSAKTGQLSPPYVALSAAIKESKLTAIKYASVAKKGSSKRGQMQHVNIDFYTRTYQLCKVIFDVRTKAIVHALIAEYGNDAIFTIVHQDHDPKTTTPYDSTGLFNAQVMIGAFTDKGVGKARLNVVSIGYQKEETFASPVTQRMHKIFSDVVLDTEFVNEHHVVIKLDSYSHPRGLNINRIVTALLPENKRQISWVSFNGYLSTSTMFNQSQSMQNFEAIFTLPSLSTFIARQAVRASKTGQLTKEIAQRIKSVTVIGEEEYSALGLREKSDEETKALHDRISDEFPEMKYCKYNTSKINAKPFRFWKRFGKLVANQRGKKSSGEYVHPHTSQFWACLENQSIYHQTKRTQLALEGTHDRLESAYSDNEY